MNTVARGLSTELIASGDVTRTRRILLSIVGVWGAVEVVSLGLVLHTLNTHPEVPIYDYYLEGTIGGIGLFVLTLILIFHRPDHKVTWAFLAAGMFGGVQALLGNYAVEAMVSAPGSLPLGPGALAASYVAQTWFVLSFVVAVSLFPTGRTLGGAWRYVPILIFLDALLVVGPTVTQPMELGDSTVRALIDGSLPGFVHIFNGVVLGVTIVGMLAHVVVRFVRSRGIERHQLKWFVFSFVVALLFVAAPISEDDTIGAVVWTLGPLAVMGSIVLAIVRHRLYEIDRVISRTVTYTLAVGFLGAGVFGLSTIVGSLFEEPLVVAATTLGVAAAFNPLRKRIQTAVDMRFNRSLFDSAQVMDGFAASLRDRIDADTIVDDWARVVSATMQPRTIQVWLRN